MKKILAIILAVIMMSIGFGLMACDNKSDERVKIYLGMWPDSGLGDDIAMYTVWKNAFEADYPQYEIIGTPYTYNTNSIAFDAFGGTLPTVFQTYFTEPEKLISEQWIRPITAQVNALGWSDKMDANMKSALSRDGELYGIPRDGYGMGLFINMDMLYEADIIEKYPSNHPDRPNKYKIHDDDGKPLYPTTFEELRQACIAIQDSTPSGTYGLTILSANRNGGWQFNNLAWNFGLDSMQYKDESGKWQARLNAPESVAALNWIRDMRRDELIPADASLTYTDWFVRILQKRSAMSFTGSDAIASPVNNSSGADKFDKDSIAFVPMPAVEGVTPKALFGGTPFVFAANATDQQVEGALKFLKYMGRSPETSEIAIKAHRDGNAVAQKKGMPILPTIRPWINEDYLQMVKELDEQYINVDMLYFQDFFDSISEMKKDEEPLYCQEMYGMLDLAIQGVLSGMGEPAALLTTANANFYNQYLGKVQ